MRSNLGRQVVSAVAGTLVLELADRVLDRLGLSEPAAPVARVIIKANVSAVAVLILNKSLSPSTSNRINQRHDSGAVTPYACRELSASPS